MGMQRNAADTAIGTLIDAAQQLAACKQREMELEDLRGVIKSEAIGRLMTQPDPQKDGKTYSATAAAEVLTLDKGYQIHRRDMSVAVAATINAMGLYEAAKLRARLETSGAEIEGFEPLRVALEKDHTAGVR